MYFCVHETSYGSVFPEEKLEKLGAVLQMGRFVGINSQL